MLYPFLPRQPQSVFDEARRLTAMSLEAYADSCVTIAERMMLWGRPSALHYPEQQGEAQMMVVEKVEAAMAGSAAALSASLALGAEAMSGRLHPLDLAGRALAVINAGFAPAHDRVGFNARRLTRVTAPAAPALHLSAATKGAEAFIIPATDGYPLGALLYEPAGTVTGTVIIAPATAVKQSFYRQFAAFLVGEGKRVISFDYRGIGASKPERLRGFKADMLDWADKDFAAVVDYAATRYPDSPLALVGHSFGGHAIGFQGDNRIQRAVTVASGLADMGRHYQGLSTPRAFRPVVKLAAPALGAALGYFPSRLFGLGESMPSGVMKQWGGWCFTPGYCFGDPKAEADTRFARYTGAITAYAFADDTYITPAAVEDFLARFTNAKPHYVLIAPQEGQEIGHFGFFRRKTGGALWAQVAALL